MKVCDSRRWLKFKLVHRPIFFRLVENGDRRGQSDLGIPVHKSLVIWVSVPLGIPTTSILLLTTKLVRTIYLSANSNALLTCLLL